MVRPWVFRTPFNQPLRFAALAFVPAAILVGGANAQTSGRVPGLQVTGTADTVGESLALTLHEGDKIQLVFYERLDVEDDKWRGRQGALPRSFHQRAELTNTYTVEDGVVSFPLLGRFPAAGIDQEAFLASVGKAFDELIERKGFVSVVGVQHPPIYVIGPVKNPGSFKYERGMTVLHAMALAGGLKSQEAETWQRVEFGREVERLQRSLDKAKRLLARTAVLESERDVTSVATGELGSLLGKVHTTSLVNEEAWQRNLTTMSRDAQESTLVAAVSNARSETQARMERLGPLDAALAMRTERVKNLVSLADRNVVGRPVVIQAQSELSDAQDRRHQALLENEAARKRLENAERELAKFRIDSKVEVNRATTASRRETAETLDDGQGVLDVVKALANDRNAQNGAGGLIYEIVRRTPAGTVVLPVADTATLMPGDLIRLRVPEAPSANASAPVGTGQTQPASLDAVRDKATAPQVGPSQSVPARVFPTQALPTPTVPPQASSRPARAETPDAPRASRTIAQGGDASRTQ